MSRLSPPYASLAPFPGAKNLFIDKHNPAKPFHVDFIFDVTQSFGLSSTGKTMIISSTAGARPIGATKASLGLNCFMNPNKGKEVNLRLLKEAFDKGGFDRVKGMQITLENEKWVRCSIGLNETQGSTKTGSSKMIATTSGILPFGKTGVSLGINCTVKTEIDLTQISSASTCVIKHNNVTFSTKGQKVILTIPTRGVKMGASAKGKSLLASTISGGQLFAELDNLIVTLYVMVKGGSAEPSLRPETTPVAIGKNIMVSVSNDLVVTLEIDSSAPSTLSSTGMTTNIASSPRGTMIPNSNLSVLLQAYRKVPGAIRRAEVDDNESQATENDEEEDVDDEDDEPPAKKASAKKVIEKTVTPVPKKGKDDATPAKKDTKKVSAKIEVDSPANPDADLPSYMKVSNKVAECLSATPKDKLDSVSIKELTEQIAKALKYQGEARDLKPYVKRGVDDFLYEQEQAAKK